MKPIISIVGVCLAAGITVGSAFTMDFAGNTQAGLPPKPLVIDVQGYGDMRFDFANGSDLVIGYGNGIAAEEQSHDSVGESLLRVSFLGTDPKQVDFEFVAVDGGDDILMPAGPNAAVMAVTQSVDDVKMSALDGKVMSVPEPLAPWLGSLGAALLVLRRRR